MKVAVHGTAISDFRRQPERSPEELGRSVVMAAVRSAGLSARDIGAVYVGSVFGTPGHGQRILRDLGLTGIPVTNLENACASGSDAVVHAAHVVERGDARYTLALGVESPSRAFGRNQVPVDDAEPTARLGMTLPGLYAMRARAHMDAFGTTPEQLAAVAVKNRAHGALNPVAAFREAVQLAEVLASPAIADPLTRLQCCPTSDGAAAVVLGPPAPGLARLAGTASSSGHLVDRAEAHDTLTSRTATAAFDRASIGPGDVDVCEVHDAFTIGELLALEGLGICLPGESGAYVENGGGSLGGGGTVVNPSGGLLSRGHPMGATGVAQVVEAVAQVTGRAGARQVDGARVAVCHTRGGGIFDIEANSCIVSVLSR